MRNARLGQRSGEYHIRSSRSWNKRVRERKARDLEKIIYENFIATPDIEGKKLIIICFHCRQQWKVTNPAELKKADKQKLYKHYITHYPGSFIS